MRSHTQNRSQTRVPIPVAGPTYLGRDVFLVFFFNLGIFKLGREVGFRVFAISFDFHGFPSLKSFTVFPHVFLLSLTNQRACKNHVTNGKNLKKGKQKWRTTLPQLHWEIIM